MPTQAPGLTDGKGDSLMFEVTVKDRTTGETLQTLLYEHVEVLTAVGTKRVDSDGDGPAQPEFVETGAAIATVKCWTGEAVGMTKYEDFVNFSDDVDA